MHKSTIVVLVFLTVVAGLLGWNYFAQPFARPAIDLSVAPSPSPEPMPVPISAYRSWLETATTREKVAQVIAYPVTLSSRTSWASVSAELADIKPGVITWFGENISVATVSAARAQVLENYPLSASQPLFAVDHEGGTVQRLRGSGFTRLPSWKEQCRMSASESAALVAQAASELQGVGISIVYGPVLDLASSSGVLGARSCDANPQVVTERSTQTATLFAEAGILPVFKHFPGIGAAKRDLHVAFDRVAVASPDAQLYRTLLKTFPAAGVMVSHVGVLNQFPELPCSLSSSCIDQLKANYPEVLVFSDALEMDAASYQTQGGPLPLIEVSRRAIEAGNQVLVFGPEASPVQLREVIDALSIAYDTNLTVRERINEALEQQAMLRVKKDAL